MLKVSGGRAMDDQAGPARPDAAETELAITFLYYRDLAGAMRFYEDVLGLSLAVDQGWCKIYRLREGAHVGLVDEARGSHRASEAKPVQLCLRVRDVDAWHRYLVARGVAILKGPLDIEALGIRAFVFNDPEGYQLEIQTATRPGA
jgi:predicted enzyme related to lactoylglutathione lyase